MRALLVANPHAGGVRRASRVEVVERHLRARGLSVTRVTSAGAAEARACLRERLFASSRVPIAVAAGGRAALASPSVDATAESAGERVIVVGGDGTISSLLPVLEETRVPLGIIPAGTFNALAGALGIPRDLPGALELAVSGRPRSIDLGYANGRPFSQILGVGFDGAVVHSVLPARNKRLLSPGALLRGARLLARFRPIRARIETEATVIEQDVWLVLVANASRYTYCVEAAPGARLDDGWLDVWVFAARGARLTARHVLGILRGRPMGLPGVMHLRARRAFVETDPPSFVHLDGDGGGCTPVDVRVAPGVLNVIAPIGARCREGPSWEATMWPSSHPPARPRL